MVLWHDIVGNVVLSYGSALGINLCHPYAVFAHLSASN